VSPAPAAWLRLDAFFLALVVLLAVRPRGATRPPARALTLWVKLGAFLVVTHALLAVIACGGPWLLAAAALAAARGSHELAAALLPPGRAFRPHRLLAMAGAVAVALAAGTSSDAAEAALVAVAVAAATLPVWLGRPAGARAGSAAVWSAVLLAGLLPGCVVRLRASHGMLAPFLFVVVALHDALAEATGRLWGRRPLAPHLSPNKTVAGLLGGLASAPLALVAFAPLVSAPIGLLAAVASTGAVAAAVGDLAFSAVKRDAGLKDFPALIPAQGGLLDRIDGFLVAAACCDLLLRVLPAAQVGPALLAGG